MKNKITAVARNSDREPGSLHHNQTGWKAGGSYISEGRVLIVLFKSDLPNLWHVGSHSSSPSGAPDSYFVPNKSLREASE